MNGRDDFRPGRDRQFGLRCGEDKCGYVVRAVTGLQEIERLIIHMRRKHKRSLSMEAALALRAEWEARA